jgi:hypothetical protein
LCNSLSFCRHFFSPLNTFMRKREGSGAGSAPLTNGPGSGRPKNMRIRISDTAVRLSHENAAGISEDGAPMGVAAAALTAVTIPTAVRNDYNIDDHKQGLVNDCPLEIVTGGQVPQDAGHQLLDVVVRRLAQQADEGVRPARRLDRPLILVILPPVGQVPDNRGKRDLKQSF